ncbi:MAG: RelA/SpoT family protein [Pseudomonadales bacterium]
MVKVRDDVARQSDGRVDVDCWVRDLAARHGKLEAAAVHRAAAFVRQLRPRGEEFLESGIELAELVSELRLDTASVVAALTYRPVRAGAVPLDSLRQTLGTDVGHLLDEILRMASSSLLEMSNTRLQTSERRDQADNVRRMLIAMIDDARVAVIKLAERVVALRSAKHYSDERKRRIAQEAHLVFAPLANRLGIWQVKWELEDLALRYLATDIYMNIAKQLDGRREEREQQIAALASKLQGELCAQGIEATVTGRAKNIYSIWRKMQSKGVGFSEVYDVRAVRVLVPNIAQCYAALGVIHTQWRHVPSEFDDYVAAPKDNGYRSIHTAVIGPDGRTLEVQIRTLEMHEQAELGVCAHWSYKDDGSEDRPYAEKMNWLRQVVEWRDEVQSGSGSDIGVELQQLFRDERIFVSTPGGHVLDLAAGSTPLDFAYRVHTEIGHRCRGALVGGRQTPLNARLATGQRVEILTAAEPAPQRRWLDAHLGYATSGRAREKIRDWFRSRDPAVNEQQGRALLVNLLDRLSFAAPDQAAWQAAAVRLGCDSVGALFQTVATGDCQTLDVLDVLHAESALAGQQGLLPGLALPAAPGGTCRIELLAADRQGLLRDIAEILSELEISLLGNAGQVDPLTDQAQVRLDIRAGQLRDLAIVVERLSQLHGVHDVRIKRR